MTAPHPRQTRSARRNADGRRGDLAGLVLAVLLAVGVIIMLLAAPWK